MRKIRFVLACCVGLWALPAQAGIATVTDLSKSYSRPPHLEKAWNFKNLPHLFSICGNGVQEVGEECDDGNSDDHDLCTSTCRNARCGDGMVQLVNLPETVPSEECDNGSFCAADGAACKTDSDCSEGACVPQPSDGCGNMMGEECDDGNTMDDDGCSSLCKLEFCGDGIVQPGEECDGGVGCTKDCRNVVRYLPIKPIKPWYQWP